MDVRHFAIKRCNRILVLAFGLLGATVVSGGESEPISGETLSALERLSIGMDDATPTVAAEKGVADKAVTVGVERVAADLAAVEAEAKAVAEETEAEAVAEAVEEKALAPSPTLRTSARRPRVATTVAVTASTTQVAPSAIARTASASPDASIARATSDIEAIPTLTVSANATWVDGTWEGGAAPIDGSAKVSGTATANLDLNTDLSLEALTLEAASGTTLTLKNSASNTLKSENVTVCGKGNVTFEPTLTYQTNTPQALFLCSTAFTKTDAGVCQVNLNDQNGNDVPGTITVAEGALQVHQGSHVERTYKTINIAEDATFIYSTGWGSGMTISTQLSGEGTFKVESATKPKKIIISGAASAFTGTLTSVSDSISLIPADKTFGGSVTISKQKSPDVKTDCALGAGIAVGGTVTLGEGVTLTLGGIGENAPTVGTLAASAPVPLVLPEGTTLSNGTKVLGWNTKPEGVSFASTTTFDPNAETYGIFSAEESGIFYREFTMAEMPTLEMTNATTWSGGTWLQGKTSCTAPDVGPAKIAASTTGTLTFDKPFALDLLEINITSGEKLTLAKPEAPVVISKSERVLVSGGGNGEMNSLDKPHSLANGLFLGCSTFEKRGNGTFTVNLNQHANDTSPLEINVREGTLHCYQEKSLDRRHGSALFIDEGATFRHETNWGNTITLHGSLKGKGTLQVEGSYDQWRSGVSLTSLCKEFEGTLYCNKGTDRYTKAIAGVRTLLLAPSDNTFGGDVIIEKGQSSSHETHFLLKARLALEGSVTLGNYIVLVPGGSLDNSNTVQRGNAADEPPLVRGGIQAEKAVTVTVMVPEGATSEKPLLTWETPPSAMVTFASDVGGQLYAQADGLYYTEKAGTLPKTIGTDEAPLSTLSGTAWQALIAEVGATVVTSVTGTTKGGTEPLTATQLNGALACFAGEALIVEEDRALKVNYDFGISQLRFDGAHWMVTAKVSDGLTFAPGVTVKVYVEGHEEPVGKYEVVDAGHTSVEIAIPDEHLKALGTHYLSVKVSR